MDYLKSECNKILEKLKNPPPGTNNGQQQQSSSSSGSINSARKNNDKEKIQNDQKNEEKKGSGDESNVGVGGGDESVGNQNMLKSQRPQDRLSNDTLQPNIPLDTIDWDQYPSPDSTHIILF